MTIARTPLCIAFFTACVSLFVLAATGAAAAESAPQPQGPEFAAEDRPLPDEGWWTSCSDARGIRTTLVPRCSDDRCEEPGDLVVERTGPDGGLLSAPFALNEDAPVVLTFYRASCHAGGAVVVQWRDARENCFVHRLLDDEGHAVTKAKRTAPPPYDCRAKPSVAVRADGSFVAAWAAAALGGGSGVVVQAFDAAGDPASEVLPLTETSIGWNRQPKVAVDASGLGLVAWLGDSAAAGADPILARAIDAGAEPVGDVMQLDTFGFGSNAPPTVTAEGGGEFLVVWSNPYQGGRVARRLFATAASERTRPIAAQGGSGVAGVDTSFPRFGAPRIVDALPVVSDESDAAVASLAAGAGASWLTAFRNGLHQTTADDGIRWGSPTTASRKGGAELAIGVASDGRAVAVVTGERDDTLYWARSLDSGETWEKPVALAPLLLDGHRCPGCRLRRAAVSVSAGGDTWVAAWSVEAETVETQAQNPIRPARIYAVASRDGGRSWSRVRTVAENRGSGAGGFALAAGEADTWVLAWIDEDLSVSRSANAGDSWSMPKTIGSGVACVECASTHRYRRLELAGDGEGSWLAVFATARYATDRYGHDGDVFSVRSRDDGVTWSAPAPLAPYADSDGWRELEPTLVGDRQDRWLVLWASHRPVSAVDDLDPDIVASVSTDAGANWSLPVAVFAEAASSQALDRSPVAAARGDGAWLLAWQRREYGDDPGARGERVLAAVTDAECGNRRVEIGEECDDGNLRNGDRCDGNCTRPGCGNGIVDDGEECDDGDHREDDACTSECVSSRCGDGIVQADEECDDGNVSDEDECPSTCRYNHCGDGYVDTGIEQCDDGNGSSNDECTNECRHAVCGDGHLHDFVEACDDGNRDDGDACPNSCDVAICGDGHTARGIEECDAEDPRYREVCTEDCRVIDLCGDADGDGAVSVEDAQRMLARSIGLSVRCPREVCDMDGNGVVRVSDARIGISAAVGLGVGARCSIGTGNLVFWIDYAGDVAALQIDVDYSKTGGSFVGEGAAVACEPLVRGFEEPALGEESPDAAGFVVFNDVEAEKLLKFAMISVKGFAGPVDLFRCRFEMEETREDVRLVVRPVDATDTDMEPIWPPPLFGYRLE